MNSKLIIFIIALLVISGGYFAYSKYYQPSVEKININQEQAMNNTPTPTPTYPATNKNPCDTIKDLGEGFVHPEYSKNGVKVGQPENFPANLIPPGSTAMEYYISSENKQRTETLFCSQNKVLDIIANMENTLQSNSYKKSDPWHKTATDATFRFSVEGTHRFVDGELLGGVVTIMEVRQVPFDSNSPIVGVLIDIIVDHRCIYGTGGVNTCN
ncbi:MAG: hypothetical protein V4486_00645 [Patescibacteria group bacterium]